MSSEWVELHIMGKASSFRTTAICAVSGAINERAQIFADGITNGVDDPIEVDETASEVRALLGIKHETDKELIQHILRRHDGSLAPGISFRFDADGRLIGVDHNPR